MSISYVQKNKNVVQTKRERTVSIVDESTQSESLQRKADMANNAAQRAEAPRPNNTGMPDNLKSGIESLSGFSMDDVRVHYNSSKPATVQALAYTQGTDIHVAPGQEKCLPHEAWHVAQQMAGRVSPTTNINGMPVNDNAALEHEADVMGEKAVMQQIKNCCNGTILKKNSHLESFDTMQKIKIFKGGVKALGYQKKGLQENGEKVWSLYTEISRQDIGKFFLRDDPVIEKLEVHTRMSVPEASSIYPPVVNRVVATANEDGAIEEYNETMVKLHNAEARLNEINGCLEKCSVLLKKGREVKSLYTEISCQDIGQNFLIKSRVIEILEVRVPMPVVFRDCVRVVNRVIAKAREKKTVEEYDGTMAKLRDAEVLLNEIKDYCNEYSSLMKKVDSDRTQYRTIIQNITQQYESRDTIQSELRKRRGFNNNQEIQTSRPVMEYIKEKAKNSRINGYSCQPSDTCQWAFHHEQEPYPTFIWHLWPKHE